MEQEEPELETVYYVTAPFETTEEEEITSEFIVESSDGHVIIVKEESNGGGNSSDSLNHEDTQMECAIKSEEVFIQKTNENSIDVPMEVNEGEDSNPVSYKIIVEENNLEEEDPCLSGFACSMCKKSFTKVGNRTRHMRRIHGVNRHPGRGCDIRCVECRMNFKMVADLRAHLSQKHDLKMDEEEWKFPNLEAFKRWKHNIERQTLSCYTLRHGGRRTARGRKWMYACHRSGRFMSKVKGSERKRILKAAGSCKLGLTCTATMDLEEKDNEVVVKYYPNHYGHGKVTTFVQLSSEEREAIQENVSAGIPFEDLLDDIREGQCSADTFQLGLAKKKDIRFLKKALLSEVYNTGLSDAESVDKWVQICCQMEESPILYYKREECMNGEEEFMLIIMTEFQKQILLSSQKQVVCMDSCYRRKGGRFYLTCLFIMDELNVAFPTAFCISNRVNKAVVSQFVSCIRDAAGILNFAYFMSDSEQFYYDAWREEMSEDCQWLWSTWYIDNRFRTQLRIFKGNILRRTEVYKTLRVLLECQNVNVFQSVFKNYINSLIEDPDSKNLAQFIQQKFREHAHMWAYCYRKDVQMSTNIQMEVMHRTFRFLSREGRKIRMDKFIFIVMKLVRFKMLDRLTAMLDDVKTNLAVEAINMFHGLGIEIQTEHISCLSDKIWLIKSDEDEESVYITRMFDSCPEHCNLKCSECDVCVHMYSCSCVHSMINANLCQHIHAVVWKFLTPHFSPPASPSACDDILDSEDCSPVLPTNCSELIERVSKRTHEVYTKIRASKCTLSKEALTLIMKKLNECIDICSGKVEIVPDPPPLPKSNLFVLNQIVNKENNLSLTAKSPSKMSISTKNQLALFPKILPKPTALQSGQNNFTVNGQQYVLLIPGPSKTS